MPDGSKVVVIKNLYPATCKYFIDGRVVFILKFKNTIHQVRSKDREVGT